MYIKSLIYLIENNKKFYYSIKFQFKWRFARTNLIIKVSYIYERK